MNRTPVNVAMALQLKEAIVEKQVALAGIKVVEEKLLVKLAKAGKRQQYLYTLCASNVIDKHIAEVDAIFDLLLQVKHQHELVGLALEFAGRGQAFNEHFKTLNAQQ